MAACINSCLFFVFLVILNAKGSIAFKNCYVCHSVNGSNPACESDQVENDLKNDYRGSFLQRNCKSLDGTQNKRTPMTSHACITILGEYQDPRTRQYSYVLSRDCSASVPAWSHARNVRCGSTNLDGYLRWTTDTNRDRLYQDGIRSIDGCMEVCSEDQCNSKSIRHMGLRFRDDYMIQHRDPQTGAFTKSRFPPIFIVRETTGTPSVRYILELPRSSSNKPAVLTGLFSLVVSLLLSFRY